MRHMSRVAATAILLLGATTAGASPFTCTFTGGIPGQPDSEGNVGPFQSNGAEYATEGETIRTAAREARLACTAGEALGAQGCMFLGCIDMAEAEKAAEPQPAGD